MDVCFLKRRDIFIELNALLLHIFTTKLTTGENEGPPRGTGEEGSGDCKGIGDSDDCIVQGLSALLALTTRARGPKEFMGLWQSFRPKRIHNTITKLRLGLLVIQNLHGSRTTVSLSQDSSLSSEDSLRASCGGRSFSSEVTLPPCFFHDLYILHQAVFCSEVEGNNADLARECSLALKSPLISQRVVISMKVQPCKEWLSQELSANELLGGDLTLGAERLKMAFAHQYTLMGSQFLADALALAVKTIAENGARVSPETARILAGIAEAAQLCIPENNEDGLLPWVWRVFECTETDRKEHGCTKCTPAIVASFWTAASHLHGTALFFGLSTVTSGGSTSRRVLTALCKVIEAHALTSGPFCKENIYTQRVFFLSHMLLVV